MTHQWTALSWEQEYDRSRAHPSVVERARDVLRRCCLDPAEPAWRPLVHEIAVEISDAEMAMLKLSAALAREKCK